VDQGNNKNDRKTKSKKVYIGILLVGLFLIILVLFGMIWWYSGQNVKNQKSKESVNTGCGSLVTEDGKTSGLAPYSPVVKAKIVDSLPKDEAICQWTINGEDYGKSKPEGDYCIRYGLDFYRVGEYKVSYRVVGLENCSKEITLKVTGLSALEEARQLEIKRAGVRPEDL